MNETTRFLLSDQCLSHVFLVLNDSGNLNENGSSSESRVKKNVVKTSPHKKYGTLILIIDCLGKLQTNNNYLIS